MSSTTPPHPDEAGHDAALDALLDLHDGLPRQGPGSDATTRDLLRMVGALPASPRILDLGCGPGRSALVLAAETGGHVTGVDLHRPYLDQLRDGARRAGLADRIAAHRYSMDALPFPDGSFDLIWSEGAAYNIGFDAALRSWRRLLAPHGALVVTEIELRTPEPAGAVTAFWGPRYPLRDADTILAAARSAGYDVVARHPLPESDWWDEYYTPLLDRLAGVDTRTDAAAGAAAELRAEIALRRDHGADYGYAGYVLRPSPGRDAARTWATRPERADDAAAVRAVNAAAFPTAEEADLVDALRADPDAWIPGLSTVATDGDGRVVGHALLTRCHVGGAPALALAPCAVRPDVQRGGAGSAAIRAGLRAARDRGENLVVVLGHADYYPRFGFTPASGFGVRAPFDVPDEAFMALALDGTRPTPTGMIEYPTAFGV